MHIFFFRSFSLVGYYKRLSIVVLLCSKSLLVISFIYSSVHVNLTLLIYPSPSHLGTLNQINLHSPTPRDPGFTDLRWGLDVGIFTVA